MKKRITRNGNTITAEVFVEKLLTLRTYEVLVASKEFNLWRGMFFEPNDRTYEKAKEWCDHVITLHLRHTEN